MTRQIISIVIALMMMTTVCACGAGGKDFSGQDPEEKAVSETVSEEAQVPGDENTQVQESVESGEEIVSNTSDSEKLRKQFRRKQHRRKPGRQHLKKQHRRKMWIQKTADPAGR